MNQKFRMRYTGRTSYKYIFLLIVVLVMAAIGTVYVLGLMNGEKPKEPDTPNQQQQLETKNEDTANAENPPEETVPQTPEVKTRPSDLKFEYVKMSRIAEYVPTEGNNAAVLELKDANGVYAADVLGADALKTAIAGLKEKNIYVIGALYAFRDDTAAKENQDAAIHYDSEQVWLDSNMKRWLNPYVPHARELALQSVDKVLSFDVDEVLLLECNFPSNGRTSLINYVGTDTVTKEQVLSDFVTEVSKKIKESEERFFSVAIPTGKNESSLPQNIGASIDYKTLGADAVYQVNNSMVFTQQ